MRATRLRKDLIYNEKHKNRTAYARVKGKYAVSVILPKGKKEFALILV